MAGDTLLCFLVDHMLGRLVTWLRVLGCDTVFASTLDDSQIARIAQQQGRIVLTRDRELARRKNIRTILVDSERVDEQLAQVMRTCHLQLDRYSARCTLCNGVLEVLPKQQAEGSVPPYVFQTQEQFWRCTGCGHLFWQGTHWERMRERLAAVAAAIV